MAGFEISLMDTKLFGKLLKLCACMVGDERVPVRYKHKMQEIIEDSESLEMERRPKVFYLCDGRACKSGCNRHSDGVCVYTSDVSHARNFKINKYGTFYEQE